MNSEGLFHAAPGSWGFPEDIPHLRHRGPSNSHDSKASNDSYSDEEHERQPTATTSGSSGPSASSVRPPAEQSRPEPRQRTRTYPPRLCRICLETVQPSFKIPSDSVPSMFQGSPKVVYESEEGGRLLRPCKCKGTSQYVHEGCLQAWRHADPSYGRRNYFQCPTCGYKYKLQRLGWARWITSTLAQLLLTISIVLAITFVLGFVADPIINFALDPYGTLLPGLGFGGFSFSFGGGIPVFFDDFGESTLRQQARRRAARNRSGWLEHFTKGFASLGLVSFLKFMFASPIQFLFRGGAGGGRHGTGRDRLGTLTWIMVAVGVATFLYTVWKGVRNLSRRALEKAGERVVDVQGDDDDAEEATTMQDDAVD